MSEDYKQTLDDYKRKGFADRSGFGKTPALLVVDFINGFTDPESPLGGDFSREIQVTQQLLAVFRAGGLPVVFTTIAYEPGFKDAGLFIKKVPSLAILKRGSHASKLDDRIPAQASDFVVEKKFASSFFETGLDALLRSREVDTVVIVGCTTSGCVRASAIDAMQYGFNTIVVREGVGDRAQGPHEANLFDIDAKYGDVISVGEALRYAQGAGKRHSAGEETDFAAAARRDFDRFWGPSSRHS